MWAEDAGGWLAGLVWLSIVGRSGFGCGWGCVVKACARTLVRGKDEDLNAFQIHAHGILINKMKVEPNSEILWYHFHLPPKSTFVHQLQKTETDFHPEIDERESQSKPRSFRSVQIWIRVVRAHSFLSFPPWHTKYTRAKSSQRNALRLDFEVEAFTRRMDIGHVKHSFLSQLSNSLILPKPKSKPKQGRDSRIGMK